jgi:hypothetical protein
LVELQQKTTLCEREQREICNRLDTTVSAVTMSLVGESLPETF